MGWNYTLGFRVERPELRGAQMEAVKDGPRYLLAIQPLSDIKRNIRDRGSQMQKLPSQISLKAYD